MFYDNMFLFSLVMRLTAFSVVTCHFLIFFYAALVKIYLFYLITLVTFIQVHNTYYHKNQLVIRERSSSQILATEDLSEQTGSLYEVCFLKEDWTEKAFLKVLPLPYSQLQLSSWRQGYWLYRHEDKSFVNGSFNLKCPLLEEKVSLIVSRTGRLRVERVVL